MIEFSKELKLNEGNSINGISIFNCASHFCKNFEIFIINLQEQVLIARLQFTLCHSLTSHDFSHTFSYSYSA